MVVVIISTRLYSPEALAQVGIAVTFVTIGVSFASGRYHLAIPLERMIIRKIQLLSISTILSFFTAIFFTMILIIFRTLIDTSNSFNLVTNYPFVICILIFAGSFFISLQNFMSSIGKFKNISSTKVSKNLFGGVYQIIFGFINPVSFNLLIALLINYLSVIIIHRRLLNICLKTFNHRKNNIPILLTKYIYLPLKSLPEAILNTGTSQISIIILAMFLESSYMGLVFISMQLLSIPMMVIGSAVGHLYMKGLDRNATINTITKQFIVALSLVSLLYYICLYTFVPSLILIVLPEKWAGVADIVKVLGIWFCLQLTVSPMMYYFHAIKRSDIALRLQVYGSVHKIGIILSSALFDPESILFYFTIGESSFNLIVLLTLVAYVRK